MKRLLILTVMASLLVATAVQAETITNVWGDIESGRLSYTRTSYDASYDMIEITLEDYVVGSAEMQSMQGTWSGVGGATLYMNLEHEGTFGWEPLTTNAYTLFTDTSHVNFESANGDDSDPWWSRVGVSSDFSSFAGSWFTTSDRLSPGEVLAVMYVSKGGHVSYDGKWGMQGITPSPEGGFSTIPEPSTLMLLACGLIGLLAYAWRRRK